MISLNDKENCCGCGACAQICPRKCISLESDKEGFLYPVVQHEICIHCKQCESVCPVLSNRVQNEMLNQCYISYAKDNEIRLKSSSGGIFTLLAEEILNRGGIVFGAAFDKEFMVHHISISSKKYLECLRGSKYVQSNTEKTYLEVREALLKGKFVLYSGTPCQIAGLDAFLGAQKNRDKLYTVDILCHGVPSPKLWKRYLGSQEKIYGSSVRKVNFRQKRSGWKSYNVELEFNNSAVYENAFFRDYYMRMFIKNISLRPSCYSCKFKDLAGISDLTIADCWGIDKIMPEMDDDMGTSLVMIHSTKGKDMFDDVKQKMFFVEADIEKVLPDESDSRKPAVRHKNRDIFFYSLADGASVEKLNTYLLPSKFERVKCKAIEFVLAIRSILKRIK